MNAGFFDMFHHATDHGSGFAGVKCDRRRSTFFVWNEIRNNIDIDFDCIRKKTIDENRTISEFADIDRFGHISLQTRFIEACFHTATTKNIRRTNKHGISNALRDLQRVVHTARNSTRWLIHSKFFQHRLKSITIFGQVDRVDASTDQRYSGGVKSMRKIERSLSAKLHDHASDST